MNKHIKEKKKFVNSEFKKIARLFRANKMAALPGSFISHHYCPILNLWQSIHKVCIHNVTLKLDKYFVLLR